MLAEEIEKLQEEAHLALAKSPEIRKETDGIIKRRVGALVDERGGQGEEREEDQSGLDAAVDGGTGDELERVLVGDGEDAA